MIHKVIISFYTGEICHFNKDPNYDITSCQPFSFYSEKERHVSCSFSITHIFFFGGGEHEAKITLLYMLKTSSLCAFSILHPLAHQTLSQDSRCDGCAEDKKLQVPVS